MPISQFANLLIMWFKDNAALAIMERAADAWEHNQFKDVIVKVANLEMYGESLGLLFISHNTRQLLQGSQLLPRGAATPSN